MHWRGHDEQKCFNVQTAQRFRGFQAPAPLTQAHVHKLGRGMFAAVHLQSNSQQRQGSYSAHNMEFNSLRICIFNISCSVACLISIRAFSIPHARCFKPTSKATVRLTTAIWNSDFSNTSNSLVSAQKTDPMRWWYSKWVSDVPKVVRRRKHI